MKNTLRENEEGLFGIQWQLTEECDQRCRHCYIYSADPKKQPVSMTWDQMREVVRKCEEFTGQMDMRPNFAITGGDPLLAPDFWKLAEYLKEKQLRYALMGNPFHLNEEVLKRLKETGCMAFQLSVDGTEETHDRFRKPGSYKKTMEMIPLISKAQIQSLVMMTVSEENFSELPDVMDAVEAAKADAFSFARYVPVGKDRTNQIPPLEYRKILDVFAKKRKESILRGSFTNFVIKDHLLSLYYYEEGTFHPPVYTHVPGNHMPAGCHCGNATLAILPDGTVMACRRSEGSGLGNLFREDLREMWQSAKEKYRQYEKHEICGNCKIAPWCRGCPAVAEAMTGDYFGRDPQCWHVVE